MNATKRKYNTRAKIFAALYRKLNNLETSSSITPRDDTLEMQRTLIFSRVRDAIREVEDPNGLYVKNSNYEEL
jgi:hypothetical protein